MGMREDALLREDARDRDQREWNERQAAWQDKRIQEQAERDHAYRKEDQQTAYYQFLTNLVVTIAASVVTAWLAVQAMAK